MAVLIRNMMITYWILGLRQNQIAISQQAQHAAVYICPGYTPGVRRTYVPSAATERYTILQVYKVGPHTIAKFVYNSNNFGL